MRDDGEGQLGYGPVFFFPVSRLCSMYRLVNLPSEKVSEATSSRSGTQLP